MFCYIIKNNKVLMALAEANGSIWCFKAPAGAKCSRQTTTDTETQLYGGNPLNRTGKVGEKKGIGFNRVFIDSISCENCSYIICMPQIFFWLHRNWGYFTTILVLEPQGGAWITDMVLTFSTIFIHRGSKTSAAR